MSLGLPGEPGQAIPTIIVPEVRDFVRINAELVALLNLGHREVHLEGAEGQRLLASGLVGDWQAVVRVEGPTGPEFAANLNAPGLRIVGRGATLDGAGRGLRSGLILVNGDAGDGVGYAQSGGLLVVTGNVGHRAGLGQSGGTLAVLASTGRLAGDRQSGGFFFLGQAGTGPYPGRGQRAGRRIAWSDRLNPQERIAWAEVVAAVHPWVDPASLPKR